MNSFALPPALILIQAAAPPEQITHIDSSTPREVQIRIAKLAGPKEVTDRADIYVLGERGYELAERGDNGFSCLVEREQPDTMEPECYDGEGTKTTLKVRFFVEQQRATKVTERQVEESVKQGYKSGKFRPPSKPGIVYMLSDFNYVLDPETKKIIHFPGHLMFYAPYATEQTVGNL